jgi:DNA-binding transcriptional LysR family regulator
MGSAMDRLKGIESFICAAQAGSFAAAAKRLRLSRAMISRRIFDLEEHLGVRLLHRTTRKLALTSAGRQYLEVCKRVMQQLENEERALGTLQKEPKGLIRIVAVRSFGHRHMSGAIARFSMLYPDIHIQMELAPGTRTPITLNELSFDLGIAIGRTVNSDAVMQKIAKFVWVMCASRTYLERKGTPQAPGDLANHDCIINPRLAPRAIWNLQCGPSRVEQQVGTVLSITSSLGCREAALADAGIAMLPSFSVVEDLRDGRLISVLPSWSPPAASIYAVYPHFSMIPKKVKLLTNFLEHHFEGAFDLPDRNANIGKVGLTASAKEEPAKRSTTKVRAISS